MGAALFAASSLQAQTIYWGAGHTDPHIDSVGRFAAGAGTLSDLGWTPNGNASPATATWTRSATGRSNATITNSWATQGFTSNMTSPSIGDGAAIFNCDSLAVAGAIPAAGGGANLVSPIFDLSAAASGQNVAVKFYVNYFDFQTTTFDLVLNNLSTGDVTTVNIRNLTGQSGVRAAYNGWVTTFVDVTAGFVAADLDSFTLSFNYSGNYYFFAVDDVSVIDAPQNDLSIGVPTVGNTLGNAFSTVRISNNYSQPLSQVGDADYGYGAKIINRGPNDIDALNNPRLMVIIERETAPMTWVVEHTDSLALGDMVEGRDSNFSANFAGGWMPTQIGRYRTTYITKSDVVDGNPMNDTSRHIFNITDNYYSKLPTNADGYPDYTGRSFPGSSAGNLISEFEYGSMFYFPAGDSAWRSDSVTFRLYAGTVDTANFNTIVNVRIYRFRDLDNDGTLSDDPTSGELQLVALGSDTIVDITTGYKRGAAVALNLDGETFYFKDTTTYLVTLDQRTTTGLSTAANRFRGFFFGSYNINYGLNAALFNAVPSPVRVAEISAANGAPATNDWNWIGFGARQVPSIGVSITLDTMGIAVNRIEANSEVPFRLAPNPASTEINVTVELAEAGDVQYLITDVSGRIVRMAANRNVQNEVATFNVSELSAGVYFVTVKTAKGSSTQRFVKQ